MQDIFKEVLKRIKPSKEEEKEVKKIVKDIINKINIKDAKPVLGGSGKKETWLRGTHDIDIYVKFNPKKYKNEEISKILKNELKKKFDKALQKYTDYVNEENDFPPVEFISRNNPAEEAIGYGKVLMFNNMLREEFGDASNSPPFVFRMKQRLVDFFFYFFFFFIEEHRPPPSILLIYFYPHL